MPVRLRRPSTPTAPAYELCTTRRHVQRAVAILSQYPFVILDCEGKSLGHADGALSLLCLGTPVAGPSQHIFVFDMLTLSACPRSRGVLAAFLERGPLKVVWDGRMDAIEIYTALGIPLTGVLDLQVAEVVARGGVMGEQDSAREERLARHQFGYRFVEEHRAAMRGLHVVRGLQNCVEFYHPDLEVEKDASVVEMHQAGESHRWMERPLPENLLQYAATDIRLIAHLLAIFDTLGFFTRDLAALRARSERYVARTARVQPDDAIALRPSAVLMLDALGAIRVGGACGSCGKELPVSCFERARGKGVDRRKEHCRLCVIGALRAGAELDSAWVDVPMVARTSPRHRPRALHTCPFVPAYMRPAPPAHPFTPAPLCAQA